jgi:hypothetical protein
MLYTLSETELHVMFLQIFVLSKHWAEGRQFQSDNNVIIELLKTTEFLWACLLIKFSKQTIFIIRHPLCSFCGDIQVHVQQQKSVSNQTSKSHSNSAKLISRRCSHYPFSLGKI